MIYNIEQGHLTNEQILHKVNWKPLPAYTMPNIYYMNVLEDL